MTVPVYTSEDWFFNHQDGFKWKVVSIDPLKPRNYILSTDMSVMKVQPFDPLHSFPR